MNEPIRQHYVPKVYLREFVDPNIPSHYEPYVWIFNKKGKNRDNKPPDKILFVPHLYTLESKTGEKDYSIENNLSVLEGKYGTVFRTKIQNHLPLIDEEYMILCAFVSAMMQRTLKSKANSERFIDELIEMTASFETKGELKDARLMQLLEYKKNIHKVGVFQHLPDITELLFKMNIAFLVSDNEKNFFITSDDPVNLFNPDLQWQRFYSPGLMQQKIEITMSLSPQILACFSWSNLRGYAKYDHKRVADANRMIVNQAYEYIVSKSPKTKMIWFSKYPLDLLFLWRVFSHKILLWKASFLRKKFK